LEKIAVLASGGLDSAVLLAEAAEHANVYPIYVECGLPWEKAEQDALQSFLRMQKNPRIAPVTVLAVPTGAMYANHWSVNGGEVPTADEPDESVFLPGRNILLISLAAVWCSTHGVSQVAIGSLGGNPFPDATPEFFRDFARALTCGLGHEVQIKAPFRAVHKDAIIRRFNHLPLELTMTCMAPVNGKHCGQCNKCNERRIAFRRAGAEDRTEYLQL
jgi:7-cyano-7-deazaguanine synthase